MWEWEWEATGGLVALACVWCTLTGYGCVLLRVACALLLLRVIFLCSQKLTHSAHDAAVMVVVVVVMVQMNGHWGGGGRPTGAE